MGPTELWTMISKSVKSVARKRSGRPDGERYSIWHVVRIFLISVLEGYSVRTFYSKLSTDRTMRRRYGLPNQLISRSQCSKRLKTRAFAQALLDLLHRSAVTALRQRGEDEVRIVALDLTRIPSDFRRDVLAAWGFDSKGAFYGHKLGLIISHGGIILGMTLMRANWGEFHVQRRLLRMAQMAIQTAFGSVSVHYLVCDSGFDGEPVYRAAHEYLRSRVLCPARRKRRRRTTKPAKYYRAWAAKHLPHRERNQALWGPPEIDDIYHQRVHIEQVNGQLKESPLRIHEIPRGWRGVKKLRLICLAKLIIYNFALNVNIQHGRPIRQIKALVA